MNKNNFDTYKTPLPLKYYTNVVYTHGKLFIRGIDDNGDRRSFYSDFTPSVCVPLTMNYHKYAHDIIETNPKDYRDFITNEPLVKLTFRNIYTTNRFVRDNMTVSTNQFGKRVIDTKVHTSPSNMFVSEYIATNFKGDCHVGSDKLRVVTIDIETEVGHRFTGDGDSEVMIRNTTTGDVKNVSIAMYEDLYNDGNWEVAIPNSTTYVPYEQHPYRFVGNFPDPLVADEKVTLITIKDINSNRIDTWGYHDFVNNREQVHYHQCNDEVELLNSFLEFWTSNYPDAMTGWNTAVFDNTYLAKRIENVLGTQSMNLLSPIGEVEFKQVDHNEYGKAVVETSWKGVANLDYLKLYKKFTYGKRESYKLDAIAEDEIGIRKVPNPTGGSFKEFYSGKFDVLTKPAEDDDPIKKAGYVRTLLRRKAREDPSYIDKFYQIDRQVVQMCRQRFIEYNIRDVELVDKIDKKQRFVDLIMTVAYLSHCNYENVFSPVQTWDYTIYNTLLETNRVIPIKRGGEKSEKFPGAYVKSPLVGKHEFCESFDLDSLYPHILMQYNISPETIIRDPIGKPVVYPIDLEHLINKTQDMSFAYQHDYSVASSGVCFTKEKWGLIPSLCDSMYAQRKAIKKEYLNNKALHEQVVEQLRKRGLIQ